MWEFFFSVSIIFPLFSGLSGGKIHIFRNGFSLRLLSLEGNSSTNPVFWGFRSVFSVGLVQAPAVFFLRHPDFLSGIFCIWRMPLAVFFPAISAFFSSRSIFSACFVQAPAVFFPRHPDFHLKSFTFYGCCLPFFY